MRLRDAVESDLTAVLDVHRAFETAWFGVPESGEEEVREWWDLGDRSCVVVDDTGRVVATGTSHRTGSGLCADPDGDAEAAYRLLVAWLAKTGATATDALDRDAPLQAALAEAGWRHERSNFDLLRPVEGWTRDDPHWPDGVTLARFRSDDLEALHRLIYVDAGWADVPGHYARDLPEWQSIFRPDPDGRPAPLLVWEDDRLIGAALLRLFSDGTGWVGQLAVARSERQRGLGRALLLASLDELVQSGATQLGLSVVTTNRSALQLYLGVGLVVDREWQTLAAPTAS
jgi:ribosomal protein S18 acetylase RimI-like enzyme